MMGNKKRLILYGVMIVILMSLVGIFAGIYYANSEEEKEANQPTKNNIRSELWEETLVFYENTKEKTENVVAGKEKFQDGPVSPWVVKWTEKLEVGETTKEEYELFYMANSYYTAAIRLQSAYSDNSTSKNDLKILEVECEKSREAIEKLLYK